MNLLWKSKLRQFIPQLDYMEKITNDNFQIMLIENELC